jgi:hypothetical protein
MRSPARHTKIPIVKKTCIWTISDARPGVMRPSIAMNKMPNWPTPISSP